MSITGNQSYSVQNVTNQNLGQEQIDDLSSRITQNTTDIDAVELTLDDHETRITQNTADVNALEPRVTTAEGEIDTLQTNTATALARTEGINYTASNDTTYVFNRLEIRAPIQSGVSSQPQLLIYNNGTDPNNQISMSLLSGIESGQWNAASREGDCLFLVRKTTINTFLGGILFTTHSTMQRGMRLSMNPSVPSQFWSDLDMGTYGITTASVNLGGTDLNTRISAIESDVSTHTTDISTNTANISTNASDISALTATVSTNTTDIATNTANIATNTANIATNTTDISTNASDIATLTATVSGLSFTSLPGDLDCNGYDILDCGIIRADAMFLGGQNLSARITNVENDVDALVAGYSQFVTYASMGGVTAISGSGTTWNDLIVSSLGSPAPFVTSVNVPIAGGAGPPAPPLNALNFIAGGVYEIILSYMHTSDQGNNGGSSLFNLRMVSDVEGTTMSPPRGDIYDAQFNCTANENDGYDTHPQYADPTQRDPMAMDENGDYYYRYYIKNTTGDVVRPNLVRLRLVASFATSQKVILQIKSAVDWSVSGGFKMIIRKVGTI